MLGCQDSTVYKPQLLVEQGSPPLTTEKPGWHGGSTS